MLDSMFVLVFSGAVIATLVGVLWAFRKSSSAESVPDDEELVIITAGGEAEMAVCANKLEAVGIKALSRNRYGAAASHVLYGFELLVRYADHVEARRILKLDDS